MSLEFRRLRRAFHLPSSPRQLDARIDEEFAFHLAMREQRLREQGLDPADAQRAARDRFGPLPALRADCVAEARRHLERSRRVAVWHDVLHDIGYASRDVRRARGFAVATLLTLALGIGATTAAYSVVRGVLLRPLPYPHSDRLVLVAGRYGTSGGGAAMATPTVNDLVDATRTFTALGASIANETTVIGGDEPQLVQTAAVIGNFFEAVGAAPFLGRTLRREETASTSPPVVVVAYEFWRDHLAANPHLDRLHLDLHGRSYSVVGVMAPGFNYPANARLWIGSVYGKYDRLRGAGLWHAIGRLRRGATIAAAHAELEPMMGRIRKEYGTGPEGIDTQSMQQAATGRVRAPLLLVLGAVTLVLLITCASIAGATLARTESRRRELTVRSALGASRGRLVRQLLTESIARALVGGIVGMAIAYALTALLVTLGTGVTGIPRLRDVALDQSAMIVALLLTAGSGALIGLVPAWRATSLELRDGLASEGRGATADRSLAQRTMVVLQVALAVMLVVGASLLVRSFATLLGEQPGFDSHRVTTVTLSLPEDRYADSLPQLAYFDRVLAVAAAVPGVTQAAILNSASMPYTGSGGINGAVISDDDPPADAGLNPFYRLASPGFFATLKIPVLRGRDFSAADRPGTAPVAIVTQSVASHYWPHANPIGHRIKWIPAFDNHDDWLTIVGVVPDTRSEVGDRDGGAAVYVDYAQRPERSLEGMTVLLKTPHPSQKLTAALRSALHGVDPDVPMVFSTIEATINASVAYRRFVMYVITAFGGFALFLAGMSLYGLLAYSVTRRRREIGVRMALGSTAGGVLRLVVGEGMRMVIGGVVIGVAAAIALTRTMASLLYGVTSTDAASFVASVGVLFGAALLACYLPARRAAAIDPLAATRAD